MTHRLCHYLFVSIICSQVAGCAVIDQYGPRAVAYNSEATDFKSSVILLNIMRAAYREPLQFTDLSTMQGTATATSSLQGQLPVRIGGPPPVASQFLNLTPNLSFSGGPTFTTSNLNTQEFYQGIQTSIATQSIATYLRAGGDPYVILPLVVSSIELDDKKTKTTFYNSGDVFSHNTFLRALRTLIKLGLTAEEEQKDDEALSPPLREHEATDPRLLAGVVQANASAEAKSFKVRAATKNVTRADGKSGKVFLGYYELVKPGGKSAKFCFRQKHADLNGSDGYFTSPSKSTGERTLETKELSEVFGKAADKIRFDPNSCAAPKKSDSSESGAGREVATGITLRIRSVQEIIYFAGAMAREQLLKSGEPSNYWNPSGFGPEYLFKVETRRPTGDEIHAMLHGNYYTIRSDPSGRDASTQVIQFITEAWALQLSSKSLPTSNVITVVAQ